MHDAIIGYLGSFCTAWELKNQQEIMVFQAGLHETGLQEIVEL